jgi:hypothetical protein
MIIAARIPEPTERMRPATVRAAQQRPAPTQVNQMIERLERLGYRVIHPPRAA